MLFDIILFILILGFLIVAHEFGHFSVARKFKMFVSEFGIGFPPRLFGRKKGETEWSVNAIPLGGFVRIPGEDGAQDQGSAHEEFPDVDPKRFFSSKPIWQRALVLVAGVAMNFIIGWVFLVITLMIGSDPSVVVSQVSPGSPAEAVHLEAGDQLIGYTQIDTFIADVQKHAGSAMEIAVRHKGEERQVTAYPRLDPPAGEGALGVGLAQGGSERLPFFEAAWEALLYAGQLFAMIYVLLFKLIASVFSGGGLFKQLSGPVGIFEATSQATGLGFVYVAHLIALISINLAALNIFPFPALDGGRIVFLIIEKIKGSPVSAKAQTIVNAVGFGALILLFVFVSVQDILRML